MRPDRRRRQMPAAALPLHECPRCASALVQLVDAEAAGEGAWHVRRRCPDCGWHGGGPASAAALARFGRELDAGRDELVGLLSAIAKPVPHPPAS